MVKNKYSKHVIICDTEKQLNLYQYFKTANKSNVKYLAMQTHRGNHVHVNQLKARGPRDAVDDPKEENGMC